MADQGVAGQETSATAPTSSAESPASDEELRRLATLLFTDTEAQIGLADTKAQLTLAADALLVAAVAPMAKGIARTLTDGGTPVVTRLAAVLAITTFCALLISFYFALVAVRPRLKAPDHPSLLFFRQIVRLPESAFIDRFLAQSQEQIHRALLSEVYIMARIASRKFAGVRWSVAFLLFALVLWAGVEALLAFS